MLLSSVKSKRKKFDGFADYLNFDLLSKKISTVHKFSFSNQLYIQNCSAFLCQFLSQEEILREREKIRNT